MGKPADVPLTESNARVLIRGGRVIDPANGIDGRADVMIERGVIAAVGPDLVAGDRCEVVDATGKLVTPGLVDFHAHCYRSMSSYSVDPDRAGVQAGVTHVNDVGSVGWLIFHGFRDLVARRAESNVTCFLNVLALGVPENWALDSQEMLQLARTEQLITLGEHNPGMVRGIKVHVERGVMSHLGDRVADPWRGFEIAQEAAAALGINVYVHLGDLWPTRGAAELEPSSLPISAVENMKPGQVLGHCFSQHPGCLVDDRGRVSPAAREASRRGILHEVGHGLNFSFSRARAFLDAGLQPDIISSDVHGAMNGGRARGDKGLEPDHAAPTLSWSMTGTMSKVLALGVSLPDVIRMSTVTPARALGLASTKGTLSPGSPAEVSILDMIDGDFCLFDSVGDEIRTAKLLVPAITIIGERRWRCDPWGMPEFINEMVQPNRTAPAFERVQADRAAGALLGDAHSRRDGASASTST